jgi:hypothetical protein
MKRLFFLIILVSLFTSCTEWGLFHDDNIQTETYDKLEYFNKILLDGMYEVEIHQSDDEKLLIEGTNDQLANTKVNVENDSLLIHSPSRNLWISEYNKIKLIIYIDELVEFTSLKPVIFKTIDTLKSRKIHFYFKGEINTAEINVDVNYFYIKNSFTSTGNFIVRGKSNGASIRPGGSAHVNAKKLISNKTQVLHYSSGDAYVTAKNKLSVSSRASGDVYYLGSPKHISIELEADGNVFQYSEVQQ